MSSSKLAASAAIAALMVFVVSAVLGGSVAGHLQAAPLPRADSSIKTDDSGVSGQQEVQTLLCGPLAVACAAYYVTVDYIASLTPVDPPLYHVNATQYEELILERYAQAYNISTATGLQTGFSGMNATVDYLLSQATAAAAAQFTSSTFNAYEALSESGVAQQLSSEYDADLWAASASLNVSVSNVVNGFGANGNTSTSDILTEYGENGACSAGVSSKAAQTAPCGDPYGAAAIGLGTQLGSVGQYVYIPANIPFYVSCPTTSSSVGYTLQLQDGAGSSGSSVAGADFKSPDTVTVSNGGVYESIPVSNGVSSAGCSLTGQFVMPVNLAPTTSTSFYLGLCGRGKVPNTGCNPMTSTAQVGDPFELVAFNNSTPLAPRVATSDTPWTYALDTEIPQLLGLAGREAQAYWQFVRTNICPNATASSGCTLPSKCLIPPPSGDLPPALLQDMPSLTVSELESLYEAELNGLSIFFNGQPGASSPNGTTNWCQGHPVFPGIGSLPWANLAENVTAYLYVLPPGHQALGSLSSWEVQDNQLWMWPDISDFNVTLNRTTEIPTSDPLSAYDTQTGVFYSLDGNATSNGTSKSPGAALYITSCTLYGVPQDPCPLEFNSINGTLANITCGPSSCGDTPPPVGGTGSACGLFCGFSWSDPLQGLVNWIQSLTGWPASLAAFVAEVLVYGIILVAVIAVALMFIRHRNGESTAMSPVFQIFE